MNRIPTTINRLEIFLVYMDRLNMQDVADLLSINTLSVYRSIHRLEEDLGYLLFEKNGRNLVPLPSALLLKSELKPLLANINSAITSAKILSGNKINSIRIGSINSLSFDFIPYLNNSFATRKENISLSFTSESNYRLFNMLKKFELDAILICTWDGITLDPNLVSTTIFKDTLVYVTSTEHKTAKLTKRIDKEVLTQQNYMVLKNNFGLRHLFNNVMDNIEHTPNINSEFTSVFSLICSLQSNQYASIIPSRLQAMAENMGLSVQLLADELVKPHEICLITHKAIEYSSSIKELIKVSKNYSQFLKIQKDNASTKK